MRYLYFGLLLYKLRLLASDRLGYSYPSRGHVIWCDIGVCWVIRLYSVWTWLALATILGWNRPVCFKVILWIPLF
jgi:hypothetical protein